jgi:hypothetical protein
MTRQKHPTFQSGRLWFCPAPIACLRLQEMRRRSYGAVGPYTLASVAQINPAEARKGYTIATLAALGHFAVSSPSTRVRIFSRILEYVLAARAIDGLESLLLTGIDASHVAGATSLAYEGIAIWNHYVPRVRLQSRNRNNIVVFLAATQRIGFLGADRRGGLPQFGSLGDGKAPGASDSIFSPGLPGGAIGRQIAGALNGGIENMDGNDTCHMVVKYGAAGVGALFAAGPAALGGAAAAGSVYGPAGVPWGLGIGGTGGLFGGFAVGYALGKDFANDVCAGSSGPAPAGEPTDVGGTYIGEVDDPNFVTGGSPSSGGDTTSSSSDSGTYLGEVDDPNFVAGGDSSGGTGTSGGSGGTDDSGGMDNPETGTGEGHGGQPGGTDNPEADPSSVRNSGYGIGGPVGGLDGTEMGVGEGRLPAGFLRGGYSVSTSTFPNIEAVRKVINPVTPALFSLAAMPQLGDSSVGPILLRAGILSGAPAANLAPTLNFTGGRGVA